MQALYFQMGQSLRKLLCVLYGVLHFGRARHRDSVLADSGRNKHVALLVTLDRGADNVALTAELYLLFHEAVYPLSVALVDYERVHSLSAARHLGYPRYVKVAVESERESSRYRRRTHNEQMRLICALLEHGALCHAEAVLLVCNDESESCEAYRCADQGVSADNHVALTARESLTHAALLALTH